MNFDPQEDSMGSEHDLGAIFDEHVASEFETKDIEATMATMSAAPYVWHVPAMTGGQGRDGVRDFYVANLIGRMPEDAVLRQISRTVAEDRVIEEFVLEFTHDVEVPFMLPGIAPTGRRVRLPHVLVMGFEGDKVAYEHIYWDHASLLVQVGLLDPAGLPIAGAEQAERLLALAGRGGA
jgi:carboxymethylenebutenolidase